MPAPIRLTIGLSRDEIAQLAGGREIVMPVSGPHALVLFEVAIERTGGPQPPQAPPQQPAPVPAAPGAAQPATEAWRRYEPSPEQIEADRLRTVEAQIERQRAALGYTEGTTP